MKKFLALVFSLMLASCAPLTSALSVLDHVASDSGQVLKIIETTYNVFAAQHPVTPAENAEFQALLASTYAALNAGSRALGDAHDIDQGKYDAAYADFKRDFAELSAYLKAHHITPIGAGIAASQNGGQDFPTPEVIGYRVRSAS